METGDSRTRIDEFDPGNLKIAHIVPWNASDDDLLFWKQIGLRWVRLEYGREDPNVDALRKVQERFAGYGLQIYSARHDIYRSLRIQLGQEGRDEDIEIFQVFVRSLGELGISVGLYDFHPANTYTTDRVERQGDIPREFKLDDFRNKIEKQQFDREYPAEEMWEHYTYFVKAVLPVAEEAGVRLGLHPDDPPLAMMNGVAKLFIDYDGYRRAEEIAGGSESWGLKFCVGTWIEGGEGMGKDVFEMIADFGGRGKILDVDFRNVSGPMPHFVETFLGDGYVDMYQVMKALRQVEYSSGIVPDHIPELEGDDKVRRAGAAYCIAYMQALLRRANEEVG
ncbi:MAG: D-mannonate dehydratase [Gemmatimonadetes bacterium]|nr:D-mannonate dehydratase [Gemmatimonadota bacterium]